MEELFLNRIFSRYELNIVDKKHVAIAVFVSERDIFLILLCRQRVYKLVGELFAGDIYNVAFGILSFNLVDYGKHQVGLTQSRRAVKKERVYRRDGIACNGKCGSLRNAV